MYCFLTNTIIASRLLNAHRLLLKTLLRGLLPFVRSQGTRRLSSASEGLPIPALLKAILLDPKKFGSAVVSLGIFTLLFVLNLCILIPV